MRRYDCFARFLPPIRFLKGENRFLSHTKSRLNSGVFFFILNRDLSLNYKYGDKSRCLVNFIKKKFFFDLKIRMIVRPGYLIIQTVPRLYDILCLSAE